MASRHEIRVTRLFVFLIKFRSKRNRKRLNRNALRRGGRLSHAPALSTFTTYRFLRRTQ